PTASPGLGARTDPRAPGSEFRFEEIPGGGEEERRRHGGAAGRRRRPRHGRDDSENGPARRPCHTPIARADDVGPGRRADATISDILLGSLLFPIPSAVPVFGRHGLYAERPGARGLEETELGVLASTGNNQRVLRKLGLFQFRVIAENFSAAPARIRVRAGLQTAFGKHLGGARLPRAPRPIHFGTGVQVRRQPVARRPLHPLRAVLAAYLCARGALA